jgi:ribonucleotide monophosphatase NagD (HAD superfamily)
MKVSLVLFGLSLFLQTQITSANDLDWLVGCWESADGSAKEVWVRDPDGSLIGFGVVVADGAVEFYEVLRIVANQDGALAYTAYPAGQSSTTFVEAAASNAYVLFSNPDHDYPQEIAYRLEGGRLFATISALNGQNSQTFDKRRCD